MARREAAKRDGIWYAQEVWRIRRELSQHWGYEWAEINTLGYADLQRLLYGEQTLHAAFVERLARA